MAALGGSPGLEQVTLESRAVECVWMKWQGSCHSGFDVLHMRAAPFGLGFPRNYPTSEGMSSPGQYSLECHSNETQLSPPNSTLGCC